MPFNGEAKPINKIMAADAAIFYCEVVMEQDEKERAERLKAAFSRQNQKVDAGADTLLERLKQSKWTGAILILAALGGILFLLWSLFV